MSSKNQWDLPVDQPVSVDNLAETILSRRAISTDDRQAFLSPDFTTLGDPFMMPDMKAAVDHLVAVRQRGGRVAIYGDYDIDGLTATTVLAEVFSRVGLSVETYIPDRFIEGYGLHTEALLELKQSGVDTVVTVDCGITAVEPIAAAAAAGLHVIITDHHTLSPEEPRGAIALINPLRFGNSYPDPQLAGVGVAFALARALQTHFTQEFPAGQEKWLLDLVAMGTICDVVPLTGENRILALFGLQVARKSRRSGLRALAEVSGIELSELNAADFGFKFGPRLNAAGRLEHARKALSLLMTDDYAEALRIARELQELNVARRELTDTILASAREQALSMPDASFLVLAGSDWSHGVAGLVASRIAEEFSRPTLILQTTGEETKGSGRSVGTINIVAALRSQEKLFTRFGGHAAAAGLTMHTKNLTKLRIGLEKYAKQHIKDSDYAVTTLVDAWFQQEFYSPQGLDQIEKMEPTGQSNRPPLFIATGVVSHIRLVGHDQSHAQLTITTADGSLGMIVFGYARRWSWLVEGVKANVLVRLSANVWQGLRRPQLELVEAREIPSTPPL